MINRISVYHYLYVIKRNHSHNHVSHHLEAHVILVLKDISMIFGAKTQGKDELKPRNLIEVQGLTSYCSWTSKSSWLYKFALSSPSTLNYC
ncbi:hypothetical protein L1887_25559 [Cichorium endivia]|nr:hypothetical protein L1887_25559 [Cichorium endivia]